MLPDRFCERARELLGEEFPEFISALESEAVRGVRANLIKTDPKRIAELLGEGVEPIPYCQNGFTVEGEIRLGQTPEHHAGMIYAQDPGAMATVAAIDIRGDELVLDACAAPGTKSQQIACAMKNEGEIIACELHEHRTSLIRQLMQRTDVSICTAMTCDSSVPDQFEAESFDRILIDAPCSGLADLPPKPEIR